MHTVILLAVLAVGIALVGGEVAIYLHVKNARISRELLSGLLVLMEEEARKSRQALQHIEENHHTEGATRGAR